MTKIDIVSGFLGAGKTTLIKKLLAEAYKGEKLVLIENEFGEINIDGGFLKESGIQISEMSAGCICCSLVGDFNKALKDVESQFHPDRILIEPSGVGKLSDVIRAVQGVQSDELVLNGFTTVVDANKCKMYMKNFGEFFNNQVENASAIILSRTEGIRPEKLDAAVDVARVFGRVTPQQKRELVDALHRRGRTVAMTGDGVNDVLALREADCSISMSSGSAAARNVSEIVLADNDFAHMPEVVAEGRRSINNLQRSASLFLVKTVFAAVLALICIVLPPYPFIPIQMSLISTTVIGVPSFVLALEPNKERVRGNFLVNVLSRSLPASGAIIVFLLLELVLGRLLGHEFDEISTVCMIITVVVGLALIYRISQPLTTLRKLLLASMSALAVLACTVGGSFFHVVALPFDVAVATVVFCVLAVLLFERFSTAFERNADTNRFLVAAVERIEGGVPAPRFAKPRK